MESIQESAIPRSTSMKRDIAIAVLLFLFASLTSHFGGLQLNLFGIMHQDVWFHADIGIVYDNMTDSHSAHSRTNVHPIFSLATAPVVSVLSALGMQKVAAVRLFVACIAGLWLTSFYIILRLLSLRRMDATVFSLLASVSAAAVFWTTVPEKFLFGSLSILVVLAFTALTETRVFRAGYYVGISALSLSMTVTNWMSGIIATLANHSFRRTIRITIDAFVVITVLWAVQNVMFPTSEFFLFPLGEHEFMLVDSAGGISNKMTVFFLHSVVTPEIQIRPNHWGPFWPFFSVQFSTIGSSGLVGWAASIIWLLLFTFGAWIAFHNTAHRKFKIALAAIIAGQLLLHLIYGDETFLYSLHWAPLLILTATFGLTSAYRPWVLIGAVLLTAGLAFNNLTQFERVSTELWKEKYKTPLSIEDFTE